MGAYRRPWLRTDQSASRSHRRVGDRRSVLELDGASEAKGLVEIEPAAFAHPTARSMRPITSFFQLGVIRLLAFEDVLRAVAARSLPRLIAQACWSSENSKFKSSSPMPQNRARVQRSAAIAMLRT